MKDDMNLCQIIYNILKIQIQFGAYCFGDSLPSMETASSGFLVSLDTIRSAYLRLQQEGYITLTQNVGARVIKDYSKEEIEHCIQLFFSRRKNALIDLSKSLRPLLSHAQLIGLINVPPEILENIQYPETVSSFTHFTVFNHIMQAYASLRNELLLRLVWQIFMFYEVPFLSIPENPWRIFAVNEYFPCSFNCCVRQDWASLQEAINDAQDSFSLTLCNFYKEKIYIPSPENEICFTWSSYKKASQIRYSLAMDLLIEISQGQYSPDTLLPSLEKLSQERNVSVSTVRRAISLLNDVGALKSFKGIGTKVLPVHKATENCDFTNPAVKKRLLEMAQSLQILTLSCKEVSKITVSALDTAGLQKCKEHLYKIKNRHQYELITYSTLELLRDYAPFDAIRTIYTELLQQLFWGYALRSMWKKDNENLKLYISCFDIFMLSLGKKDPVLFSENLEKLMIHEFQFTIKNLIRLGIEEAEGLLLK